MAGGSRSSQPAEAAAPGRRMDPWAWYTERVPDWLAFAGPFLFLAGPPAIALLTVPEAIGKIWWVQTTSVFAVDVSILLGLCRQLEWWLVLGIVLYMEFFFLIWLVRNTETMRRWGPMDRFFARRERKAFELYQRRSWIRRFHFIGIMAFVFLPLNSGIIAGVFVGKFTGMPDRTVLLAVYLGTSLWSTFLTGIFSLSIDSLIEIVVGIIPKLGHACS